VPELPDVEGFRRELADALPGRRIRGVQVRDPGILRNVTATALGRRLDGRRFDCPRRHGKWLMLPTDGPTLLVHSGMTGHPHYAADGAEREPYERLVRWIAANCATPTCASCAGCGWPIPRTTSRT
jgi:formamidopyrimidine-DNA glycosylase